MPVPSIADMYVIFRTTIEPNFERSEVACSSFSVAPNRNGPRMRITEQYAGMYRSVSTRGSPSPRFSSVTDADRRRRRHAVDEQQRRQHHADFDGHRQIGEHG